jgi:hypothetical protein
MEVPMAQEKIKQIFFAQPKAHQFKFADLNKTVPLTRSSSLLSSSSVKQPTKRLAFLRRLPRIKSSQKKRKWFIFPLRVAVNPLPAALLPQVLQLPSK